MISSTKKTTIVVAAWLILPVAIGLLLYNLMVGPSSTGVFSIIFGWQWIFLLAIGIYLIFKSWREKSKRILLAAAVLLLGVTATFIPAYLSKLYGLYVDIGQPAGPEFNCRVWDEPIDPELCIYMSIPSITKAWVDFPGNERKDYTESYYLVLALDELALFTFAYTGMAIWLGKDKPRNQKSSPKT